MIVEKGFDAGLVLPSVKMIRTFGKSGLSPPSSVNSFPAAAIRALSVKVRSPRTTEILAKKSCTASLLYSPLFAKSLRTLGFLLKVIIPVCVASGPMFNAATSSRRKPLSSKKFGTPRLLVLSITNATSIPFEFSQGSGAAGSYKNETELTVACTILLSSPSGSLWPGIPIGISPIG